MRYSTLQKTTDAQLVDQFLGVVRDQAESWTIFNFHLPLEDSYFVPLAAPIVSFPVGLLVFAVHLPDKISKCRVPTFATK